MKGFIFKNKPIKIPQYFLEKSDGILYPLSTQFGSVFVKNGKFLKVQSIYSAYAENIARKFNTIYTLDTNPFFKKLSYFLKKESTYFNFNSVLNWIFTVINPVFEVKCSLVPKKYKKKLKTTYILKPWYVFGKYRLRKGLRILGNKVRLDSSRLFSTRVFKTLDDVITNYKHSDLYVQKIKLYRLLLR